MPTNSSPNDRVDFYQDINLSPDMFVVNITHSADADGHASAMIIKKFFKRVLTIATNHGKQIDYRTIPFNAPVIITDFSLPVDEMRRLMQSNPIIWIDHHQTYLLPEYQEFAKLNGYRSTECAGCKLTWKYFFGQGAPVPKFIEYVSDYDTWTFAYPETLAFNYGLNLFNIQPKYVSNVLMSKLFNDPEFIAAVVNMGQRLEHFHNEKNKLLCKWNGFKATLYGLKVNAMNIRNTSSKVLEPMLDPEHQLSFTYGYNQQIFKYRCSLYATDTCETDCSVVMQKLGGGGHKGAAGGQCDFEKLPLEFKRTKEPPVEDDYITQIVKMCQADPLLYKAMYRDLYSLIKLSSWQGKFFDHSAYFINSPLWDINAFYQTNMIADYELVVFWSMSASGWYRFRIYSLERNHRSVEELAKLIPGSVIRGDSVWYYGEEPPTPPKEDIPVEPPPLQATSYYRGQYRNNWNN